MNLFMYVCFDNKSTKPILSGITTDVNDDVVDAVVDEDKQTK